MLCTESTCILFCVLLSLPLQCKHALANIPKNIFKIINNEKKAHDKRHVHASYCNASGLANVLFLLCPTVAFDFLTLKWCHVGVWSTITTHGSTHITQTNHQYIILRHLWRLIWQNVLPGASHTTLLASLLLYSSFCSLVMPLLALLISTLSLHIAIIKIL